MASGRSGGTRVGRRGRSVLLAAVVLAALVLLRWAEYLGQVLPDEHRSRHWRLAWVGLDVAVAVCLAAAAWTGSRRHRAAVQSWTAAATLLLCDAWFDVVLEWDSPARGAAVALAVLGEVPVALTLLLLGRRVAAGGVPVTWVDPAHAVGVYADPDCRRIEEVLVREGPATAQVVGAAAGLPVTLVADALDRMRAAGSVRRRWDGRWQRLPQDLRWPDPVDHPWRSAQDRDRYERFLAAKFDREVQILHRAADRRDGFGRWATGSRADAFLTAAELDALEAEYLELVIRYGQRRHRPAPGTRHLAMRWYAFPHTVIDEVDAERDVAARLDAGTEAERDRSGGRGRP